MSTEERGFKKLLGRRIYIKLPKKEESKLTVDENTKAALEKELLLKMSRLTIHTVGAEIEDPDIVEGAEVLIDPSKLSNGVIIPLSPDKNVLLISVFDIVHVW